MKEAAARIKINKLLETRGWRFFADAKGPANIQLEPSVALTTQVLDALGENFEKVTKGFIDFLLLNEKGFPFIVLEAKAENKNPLVGKEQARRYAKSQNCRFVILSNGNLHYFWDLERGNPYVITAFPTPTSVTGYQKTTPDPKRLIEEAVGDDYVVLTQPTFRYSLLDGVKEGFLVNPTVVDARSEVTTQLLSDGGFVVEFKDDAGDGDQQETYKQSEFEKRFFSKATNQLFCKVFLENALRDPVSGEIGKSIIFAVSQNHAAKLAQILNVMADKMFPGKYQSDFAVQVTSQVDGAQQHTINFTNNKLLGSANFIPTYKTSKARICVTVGMMTTGYDCPDILNLGLFRPIFSPTDFIQIKGRGTRKHDFRELLFDEAIKESVKAPTKTAFKLFDFFANCEYFEAKYNYDQVLKLPKPKAQRGEGDSGEGPVVTGGTYEHLGEDILATIKEETIGFEGMKIDRMFYEKFEDTVRENDFIAASVEAGQWDRVIDYVNKEVFDKPTEFYNLDKLRKAAAVDRRLTLREILEKVFGLIPRFKSKDELLEEEFSKFVADYKPQEAEAIPALKTYFKAYVTDGQIRHIIDEKDFADLATNPVFSTKDFKAVPAKYRALIPEYIKDYVSMNQFAA
jgi:type I restriction enzyme R subunit